MSSVSQGAHAGRSAMVEQMKAQGLDPNALIARTTPALFGKEASFPQLSAAQQNTVLPRSSIPPANPTLV